MSTDDAPGDPGWDDLDAETKHEILALANTINDDPSKVTRRDVLAGAGAVGAGALLGGGATQALSETAAASHGGATIGTSGDPIEMIHTEGLSSLQSLDTDKVSINDGGNWNGATVVRSETEYGNLVSTAGATGIIPSGETVSIGAQTLIDANAVSLWIQPGATLKMANGADLNAVLDIFETDGVRVRVDGTIDANRANQTSGERACIRIGGLTDGSPARDNVVYGAGVLTGGEQRAIKFNQELENCEVRGVTIKDFAANTDGQQAADFAVGGSGNVRRPVGCGLDGVTFRGDTWDTSTAAADGVSGSGARSGDSDAPNYVTNSTLFEVPRRGIFGPNQVTDNRIVRPANAAGAGGDAITGGDIIQDNVLIGTFDSSGDNGIIVSHQCTVSGNYVEGFSNNGIRFDTGFTTPVEMITISGNKLVDNNQGGTSGNGNLRLTATDASGGFIVTDNICYGENIDPLNNIAISSTAENGRVTENVTQGATTEIADNSPASTTVTNNVTI